MSTYFTSANAGSANANWEIEGGVLANAVPGTPTIALGSLSGWRGQLTDAAGGTVTYRIGDNNDSSEFDGTIADGSGTVALTKIGAGNQILGGANTYSGGTTLGGGLLEPAPPAAFPISAGRLA
jgi:autotransporter-associated beta strand protein